MLEPAAAWAAVVVAFLATVVLAVSSALIERSGPIRLRHWVEKAGGRLLALYEDPARFEAFRFVLSFLARIAPVALLAAIWALLQAHALTEWFSLVAIVAVLFLIEGFNRLLVASYAEEALRRLTAVLRFAAIVLGPAVWLLSRFGILRDPGDDEDDEDNDVSDDEIDAYIDVGRREGILDDEDEELVRSIVDFGDTRVRSVMTPRVEMVTGSVEAGLEELAQRFFESKHARLPLYRESIDEIVGILHIRDLFEALHESRSTSAGELAKPPFYVPENKPLPELLAELQRLHQQMAIVVDEYGGVAGLVTVEDLVEEIVGEISDEHETPDEAPVQLEDGWRVPGRTTLAELEELFDADLDDELPYETVSGMICGELGYVPKPAETLASHGLLFTTEDADDRRILRVSVRRAPPKAEP